MKRVCVFCGSRPGARPEYLAAARATGRALAEQGLELVYGGAKVGLMGAVADAALAAGARVTGVIPGVVADLEVAHTGLTELRRVSSMHERKQQMADLSDGFIALPGGIGTFEEFCEIMTWGYLGMHSKPCGLLNAAGYYDKFLEFFDHARAEGFMADVVRRAVLVGRTPEELLEKMRAYRPEPGARVLSKETR